MWMSGLNILLCLGVVRFTLVRGGVPYVPVSYSKDELMNVDIEAKEENRDSGILKGWDQKYKIYSRTWNQPYDQDAMQLFQDVSDNAKSILDNLNKYMKENNSESDIFDTPKKNKAYFQLVIDSMTVNAERQMLEPGNHQKHRMKHCLAITNTMLNSRLDIQKYYQIRYMYTWTLHFEVGYLSQEILRHYTVAIELFHLVVTRFDKQPYDDHTPSRYMLYMYSVILYECKMIIKLCHMLHEVEKKYSNFVDHTKMWRELPGSGERLQNAERLAKEKRARAWKQYNDALAKSRADRLRALKKKNKKALQTLKGSLDPSGTKKGNMQSGSGFGDGKKKTMTTDKDGMRKWSPAPADYFYASFNASNQKKSLFPHIYGWSIENFPPEWTPE